VGIHCLAPEGRVRRAAASGRRAVFLDRDGVLNRFFVHDGVTHPPANLGELEILPEVPAALARLAAAGFKLVAVTNQPDVARGTQTRAAVEAINGRLVELLPLATVLTCYHDDAQSCDCRKPKPGMLTEAALRWGIELGRSFMVGDRWSDVVAGQAAGCRAVLIRTPFSRAERCRPDHMATDLAAAADWILRLIAEEPDETVR
jgi:D-glycero-D-manno-heptose 1,7-bisphosphate phosphatase